MQTGGSTAECMPTLTQRRDRIQTTGPLHTEFPITISLIWVQSGILKHLNTERPYILISTTSLTPFILKGAVMDLTIRQLRSEDFGVLEGISVPESDLNFKQKVLIEIRDYLQKKAKENYLYVTE